MLVLRLGIQSCFIKETTCPSTAPELFYSSLVFVCLSLLAWAIIFLGYLIPFIFVAMLLARNGYFPNGSPTSSRGVMGGRRTRHSLLGNGRISGIVGEVMPNHLSNPAPHGTLDRLRVVLLNELPDSYQKECCVSASCVILCRLSCVLILAILSYLGNPLSITNKIRYAWWNTKKGKSSLLHLVITSSTNDVAKSGSNYLARVLFAG